MEFWQSIAVTEMDQLIELAQLAEEVGFAGVSVADHLVKPLEIRSRYPYSEDGEPFWEADEPFPDPWVLIAALAAETSRVRLMPYIYVLPLREPFSVAKAVSSAAVLSGDRVVLGAGVGWMQEEFELVEQAFAARGRRTDEMLEVFEKLMSGAPVAHEGEFYNFDPVQMSPVPNRRIEVRIGGHSPAALRRAARHDGWVGVTYQPEELEEIVATLHEERVALGRGDQPFDVMLGHYSTRADADEYARYRDAGATSFHVPPWRYRGEEKFSFDQKRRSLEVFAERYIVPMAG